MVKQELALIKSIDLQENEEDRRDLIEHYYAHRDIQLNPIDFLAEDDELYFITGRSKRDEEITMKWAKRYFPMAKVIVTRDDKGTRNLSALGGTREDWNLKQAIRKFEALVSCDIKVYFEDNPEVVKILRVMTKDTEIKIIQFGGRLL